MATSIATGALRPRVAVVVAGVLTWPGLLAHGLLRSRADHPHLRRVVTGRCPFTRLLLTRGRPGPRSRTEPVMSDLELKRKESLTKAEVAKRLSAFAKALAGGDDVELEMGGTSMSLRVPDDVRVEFEVEVDGDEIEVEIELKWSTSSAADRAEPAPERGGAEGKNTAEHANSRRNRRA